MGSALAGGWGFQWEGQGQHLGVLKFCYHSELNFLICAMGIVILTFQDLL